MLTSLQNPLVKQLKKLHRAKDRREQGVCLLEGTHLVEAAAQVDCPLVTLCYTEAWQHRHPELWQWAHSRAIRAERVSPEVLQAIATTVTPDGVVATIPRPPTRELAFQQLGLVLETIQDPGNLGTLIRTAAAVGVDGILLSADSVDPDHPKVLRSSAGLWFQVPMTIRPNLQDDLRRYQQQGIQVIATLPSATRTYWEIDFRRPTVILLGNEGAGLSPEVAALADATVTIPLAPGVESLNVAIAAALILYEVQRQRLRGCG